MMLVHYSIDVLIGAAVFLLVAPFVFALLAVAISILQGLVILLGSLVVSAKEREWQVWAPGWAETPFFEGF